MTREQDVPDWLLERYRLSEVTDDQRLRVERALAADPSLEARLAALERETTAELEAHPPRVVVAAVRARLATEARPRPTWEPALALAAPALLAVIAFGVWRAGVPVTAPNTAEGPGTTRVKGLRPQLLLFRKVGASTEALRAGAHAREGDVVQLAYQAGGQRYGVIVSVDGRGVVTEHLPRNERQAAALRAGGAVPLTTAYRLDDAPRFEVFYFVTADEPFATARVVAAAREAVRASDAPPAAILLPPTFQQAQILLRKDERR
jgi:anti-sigma factor RsiW